MGPKGTFDLEEWKRFYSNNDEPESVKWFWEHFDHEDYSIWRGDYKYNDELTMVFMSCNLIGGMFQRLDKLNKNAFASVCLFDRTMTVPSPESGCLRVMNSHLSWMTIGRLTTLAITGRSLIASQMKPKSW